MHLYKGHKYAQYKDFVAMIEWIVGTYSHLVTIRFHKLKPMPFTMDIHVLNLVDLKVAPLSSIVYI
jgi:hypothetical protein